MQVYPQLSTSHPKALQYGFLGKEEGKEFNLQLSLVSCDSEWKKRKKKIKQHYYNSFQLQIPKHSGQKFQTAGNSQ